MLREEDGETFSQDGKTKWCACPLYREMNKFFYFKRKYPLTIPSQTFYPLGRRSLPYPQRSTQAPLTQRDLSRRNPSTKWLNQGSTQLLAITRT